MQELKARPQAGSHPPLAMQTADASAEDMASELPQTNAVAFAEIANTHSAMLHRVAQQLSGNAEVAKDLVQETLLRGWRRFDQPRQSAQLATWLVTILTNLFFDQLRHEKVKSKAKPALAIQAEVEEIECDPAISCVSDDQLRAAVQMLEPNLRDVVELCYLKQMRYRDAAMILNVRMGTIGTRLMRARERLHDLLTTSPRDVKKP
jgi:RNA polymerase sigma-70 factor (ECF subfamily)